MTKRGGEHFIFDLGGVIINLNTQLTIQAFAEITGKSIESIVEFSQSHPIFHAYEKGEATSEEFRAVIRSISEKELSTTLIDEAWNAMILDLPSQRIELLQSLQKKYDTYLLSNTNYIHMERVNQVRLDSGHLSFDQLFTKDYYSHLMGKRKPNADIFEQVLEENNLSAASTVFFDDNIDNIRSAEKLGIQTLHVTSPQVMMNYFNER